MKMRERPATNARPEVATGNEPGLPARAPRYATYGGPSGSTHGEMKDTSPARTARPGLIESRLPVAGSTGYERETALACLAVSAMASATAGHVLGGRLCPAPSNSR